MTSSDGGSGSYRVAFQLVGEVLAVLDEVAALPRRNADPVVAGELVLRAPRQGQVDPGGVELVAVSVLDQPQVAAHGVTQLSPACRVRPPDVFSLIVDATNKFPITIRASIIRLLVIA